MEKQLIVYIVCMHPRNTVDMEGSVILLQSTVLIHQNNDYQKLHLKIANLILE